MFSVMPSNVGFFSSPMWSTKWAVANQIWHMHMGHRNIHLEQWSCTQEWTQFSVTVYQMYLEMTLLVKVDQPLDCWASGGVLLVLRETTTIDELLLMQRLCVNVCKLDFCTMGNRLVAILTVSHGFITLSCFCLLVWFELIALLGAQCRGRHRGSEGVRARNGQGVPAGPQDCPEDQGQGHRAWGHRRGCRWVGPPTHGLGLGMFFSIILFIFFLSLFDEKVSFSLIKGVIWKSH